MLKAIYKFSFLILVTVLEYLARFLWLMLPLGFHIFMLQMREKVDTLPALSGYYSEDSTWSTIYDGVVLVNTNPGGVRKKWNNLILWFKRTKYNWITAGFLIAIGLLGLIAIKVSH